MSNKKTKNIKNAGKRRNTLTSGKSRDVVIVSALFFGLLCVLAAIFLATGISGKIQSSVLLGTLFTFVSENFLTFYTAQLSLTFITISVMSVLSDNSVIIYWANMVERKLIVPKWSCFYAFTVYCFSTVVAGAVLGLLHSFLLYLLVFSIDIFSLICLTMSMIDVYYNHDVKRLRLRQDFEEDINQTYTYEELTTLKQKYRKCYGDLLSNTLLAFENNNFAEVRENLYFYSLYHEYLPLQDFKILLKKIDDVYLNDFIDMFETVIIDDTAYRKRFGNTSSPKYLYLPLGRDGNYLNYVVHSTPLFDQENEDRPYTFCGTQSCAACDDLILAFFNEKVFNTIVETGNYFKIDTIWHCLDKHLKAVVDANSSKENEREWNNRFFPKLLELRCAILYNLTIHNDDSLLTLGFYNEFYGNCNDSDREFESLLPGYTPTAQNIFEVVIPQTTSEWDTEESVWKDALRHVTGTSKEALWDNLAYVFALLYPAVEPEWLSDDAVYILNYRENDELYFEKEPSSETPWLQMELQTEEFHEDGLEPDWEDEEDEE